MGFWVWVEDKISEGSKNALMLIAPWLLLVLSIFLLIGCGINFHYGAEESKLIKLDAIIEDIATNPGDNYYEWGALWGTQAATWEELEDDFAPVQEDWAKRGLKVDWEFMTHTFNEFKFFHSTARFSEYSDFLFTQLHVCYGSAETGIPDNTIVAIVLLIIGILMFLISAVWIKIIFFG